MMLGVQNMLFDSPQSIAAQFLDSSGSFTLVRAKSDVITVKTSITTGGSSCDYTGYARAALSAAIADGYDNPETAYDYRWSCYHQ